MPSIALCDDDPRDLDLLVEAVKACRPEGDDALLVSAFASPVALLDRMERQGPFDLYLLDVVMPDAPFQGIELGRRIRALDDGACIVYLTVSPDFALEAYGAHPFDYLLKPVDPARLAAVLDAALARTGRRADGPSIVVKTATGLARLSLDDIAYAETAQRAVRYRLRAGGEVLVNLDCVEAMGKTTLRLEGGAVLPLTRLRAAEARSAWLERCLREGAGMPKGAS